ncbi:MULTISPECIES: DUF7620 family protein [Streptomyces]|uniref:DUF7620 family protein n=1 Tax=Streptomyces TaxID=1883 RepID=UPI00131C12E3|nr:hypothetical protein [Streptomyces sp. NRRL F-4707]
MIAWIKRLVHGSDRSEQRPSDRALERAREARQAAEARQPAVEAVVAKLRLAQQENHFRERIEAAFRGATR